MFRRIEDFTKAWEEETKGTLKLFDALTDASMTGRAGPEGRTLGRIAWHITLTLREMIGHAGLGLESPKEEPPVPERASQIRDKYAVDAAAVADVVAKSWTDSMLDEKVRMYGDEWSRGSVLYALIIHQTHHRGQMTVLMRQAGLAVPGLYGPAKEEWAAYGMPAPE